VVERSLEHWGRRHGEEAVPRGLLRQLLAEDVAPGAVRAPALAQPGRPNSCRDGNVPRAVSLRSSQSLCVRLASLAPSAALPGSQGVLSS